MDCVFPPLSEAHREGRCDLPGYAVDVVWIDLELPIEFLSELNHGMSALCH
jgi:hypothetical protein